MADQPKVIISTSVVGVLGWHMWTILSISGTFILLYLNFTNYSIGGELGSNSSASANILGVLQIVVKVHELLIVASLVAIVEQCILRDLLGDGLLLGLLGAEGALANPSFLISKRFRLAAKFGIQSFKRCRSSKDNQDHRRTLWLVSLMIFCCVIAGLAGPASAVLMIPRVNWFFRQSAQCSAVLRSTIPTIMIGTAPGLLNYDAFMESNPFAFPNNIVGTGFQYWQDMSMYEFRFTDTSTQDMARHQFHDSYGQLYLNTSGSFQRPLDGNWTGGTRITTTTRNNFDLYYGYPTDISLPELQQGWAGIKSVYTTHGFDASITCRAAKKLPCEAGAPPSRNSSYPDWCYRSVDRDNRIGDLQMSRNLLMSRDFVDGFQDPRVWLTEGPRIDENPHYSDSIEVLFEKRPDDNVVYMYNLTVCSFSAVLVTAIATSYSDFIDDEKVEYLGQVFRADGTTAPPRRFLFHQNWLDRAYNYDPDLWLSQPTPDTRYIDTTLYTNGTPYSPTNYSYPTGSMVYPDNFTYPARPGLRPRMNGFGNLGLSVSFAPGYPTAKELQTEAFPVEATVGGILTYLLSNLLPSDSQYTMPYDQIPEEFRLGPPESFGRPYIYDVYLSGYGFKLSSRTGYLGVAVLLSHAALALAASLWQFFRRRGVIRAWSTVPDYVCLGSGSSSLALTHPNTCAGIAGKKGLCSVVKVAETGYAGFVPHLEIVAVGNTWTTATAPVDLRDESKRYGFIGPKLKME